MVLESLTGLIYDLTAESWLAASIIVKYYFAAAPIYLYAQKGLTRENFEEKVLDDFRLVVPALILVGAGFFVSGLEFEPFLRPVSELIALTYFGFLFWRF